MLIFDGKCQFCLWKMLIFVDKLKRNCQKGPKPCSNDARRNLLSNDVDESFWDALWLELWPFEVLTCVLLHFSFFQVGFRHCHHAQSMRRAICYHNNKSAASETPCGLSYGLFCIFMERNIKKKHIDFRSSGPSHNDTDFNDFCDLGSISWLR